MRESAKIGPMAAIGLHPAAAFGVAAVDTMLFGTTAATLGAAWLVSIPVGIALGIGVGLIQHRSSPLQDDLGLAAGKGILVAVLTAIPTAIPSATMIPCGIAGAVTMSRNRRRAIEAQSSDGDSSD